MEYLDTLYDICETLMKEMDKANEKIRMGGGEISSGDVEYLDKLTHAVKSVKTTIAMEEASYDDGGSYEGGSYESGRGGRGGRSNRSYEGGSSYARGRGRNARRDSMGRYSREGGRSYGYSRDDAKEELMEHLKEMKRMAKDEETRRMVGEWERDIERS